MLFDFLFALLGKITFFTGAVGGKSSFPKPLPPAEEAARIACLDKKNVSRSDIVLTVPWAKGEYRLLTLDAAEYGRELARIGRLLC